MKVGIVLLTFCALTPLLQAQEWRAGTAKIDITPDIKTIKIQLGGYGARLNMPPTGVNDPIYARALVLQQGKTKVAIVALDHLLVPGSLTRAVLERIKETGIREETLFMAASHTHCAPDAMGMNDRMKVFLPGVGSFIPEFLTFTADKIAQAIREANQHLTKVQVAVNAGEIPGLNRNRRGRGITDPTMTVAKFTNSKGQVVAALVVYAAHPTIYGHEMMQVSAEFPGVLQNGLEQQFGNGAVALYLNGAQGDVSPGADEGKTDDERVQLYGNKLLQHTLRLLKDAQAVSRPTLKSAVLTISLPEPRPHPEFQESAGQEYKIPAERLNEIVKQVAPTQTPVSAMRLGPLMLIGFPGEPITELGLHLKKYAQEKGVRYPAPVALTNEWVGYILTAAEYERGGYEATVSFHGSGLGEAIEKGLKQAVDKIK